MDYEKGLRYFRGSCPECGALGRAQYEGPFAEAFGRCVSCEGPIFTPVGDCPECGGLVFELNDKFACINEILGFCDFKLDLDYLEHMGFIPYRQRVKTLLEGPEKNVVNSDKGGKEIFFLELLCGKSGMWFIAETERRPCD